jgi:hypothetical protein
MLAPEPVHLFGLSISIFLAKSRSIYAFCTEVEADAAGLNPAGLEAILSSWSVTHSDKRFPKLLYTIPTGSNPTGASAPEHRKREVCDLIALVPREPNTKGTDALVDRLSICKKYNILVLEDDAYYVRCRAEQCYMKDRRRRDKVSCTVCILLGCATGTVLFLFRARGQRRSWSGHSV